MKKTNIIIKTPETPEEFITFFKYNNPKNLEDFILSFGNANKAGRKKIMKMWKEVRDKFSDQKDRGKIEPMELFMPVLEPFDKYEDYTNYLDYLKLTLIDEKLGIKRAFISTQDYRQEAEREFRVRRKSEGLIIDKDKSNPKYHIIKKRDEEIFAMQKFLEEILYDGYVFPEYFGDPFEPIFLKRWEDASNNRIIE